MKLRPRTLCAVTGMGLACLLAAPVSAADQKLVLTDGSDHVVRSYQVQGDRVRYYSTERQEWEEIPASLVDWEATEEARREAEKVPEVALEPAPEAAPGFAVAPGVTLPKNPGVYAYDGKNLLRLEQSRATLQKDRKRSILGAVIPIPGIKARTWMELSGAAAKIFLSGPTPVFYVQLSQLSPAGFGLARLEQKKDRRIVGQILVNPLTRSSSESHRMIPSHSEPARPDGDGGEPPVIRLSPQEPLRPGEYAVVEFVEEGELNLFVWDFHLDAEPLAPPAP